MDALDRSGKGGLSTTHGSEASTLDCGAKGVHDCCLDFGACACFCEKKFSSALLYLCGDHECSRLDASDSHSEEGSNAHNPAITITRKLKLKTIKHKQMRRRAREFAIGQYKQRLRSFWTVSSRRTPAGSIIRIHIMKARERFHCESSRGIRCVGAFLVGRAHRPFSCRNLHQLLDKMVGQKLLAVTGATIIADRTGHVWLPHVDLTC